MPFDIHLLFFISTAVNGGLGNKYSSFRVGAKNWCLLFSKNNKVGANFFNIKEQPIFSQNNKTKEQPKAQPMATKKCQNCNLT